MLPEVTNAGEEVFFRKQFELFDCVIETPLPLADISIGDIFLLQQENPAIVARVEGIRKSFLCP